MPDAPEAPTVAEPLPPRLLQETASTFGMLSATVRLHILWLLAVGDCDVGTLAEQTGQSMATVSHHLGKLKLAGLVGARRHGKRQVSCRRQCRRPEAERPHQRGRRVSR